MTEHTYDIVVVGSGIAGLAAGLRAAELDRSVAVLEKSPEERQGGQTRFSESFRVPSAETDLSEWGYEFDIPDYTADEFYEDIMARTDGLADEALARTLVDRAGPTVEWLTAHGIEWDMEPLAIGYTVGRTWMDGEQLVSRLTEEIRSLGGDIYYDAEARGLEQDDDLRITGVRVAVNDEDVLFRCDATLVAAGGYESSPEKRARYYGRGFDDMKVRGSRYNTGEAIDMAIENGAKAEGQWSGAHMAIIDANAPDVEGGANRVDGYQYGVILNVNGERFVDEGEDARAHTYAKFGRRIFQEPKHRGYIVLDTDKQELARATGPTDPYESNTLEELFAKVDIDREVALETVREYNEACDPDEFDPHVLDGNDATEIKPEKSNWATPIDDPPFYAYPVTGGITFAFGGVLINDDAEVLDSRERVIPGLYAAGNSTGRLFYNNYPGGTGLMNAAVYGKIAAESADEYVDAD